MTDALLLRAIGVAGFAAAANLAAGFSLDTSDRDGFGRRSCGLATSDNRREI